MNNEDDSILKDSGRYFNFVAIVKFTMRTNLPKLLDLQIFCIYSLNFSGVFHHDFFCKKSAKY